MLFEAAGLRLYNEAILITAPGSLPIRVRRQFEAGRKLGKTHQNILVFVKGDARKATEAVGPAEVGDMDGADLPSGAVVISHEPAIEAPEGRAPDDDPASKFGTLFDGI